MKRFVILLIVLFSLFQLSSSGLEGFGKLTEKNSSAFDVTLDVSGGAGSESYIDIGFSQDDLSNISHSYVPTEATSVNLEEHGGIGRISESETLYVYWVIRSGQPLIITLYASDQMAHSNNKDTLDWTISWGNGASKVVVGDEHGYGASNSEIIFDRSIVDTVGDVGAIPLTIETDNFLNQAPGLYSGEITLVVTPSGVSD